MGFKNDLQVGEEAEKEFESFLKTKGYNTGRNTSQTVTEKRFYDLWAQTPPPEKAKKKTPRPVITFEIKKDRRVQATGNVFLEHESLENSRADYIVYWIDVGGFYLLDRGTVLSLLYSPQFQQKSGKSYSPGTLVPLDVFKKIFVDAEKAFT